MLTFIGWLLSGLIMFGGFWITKRDRKKAFSEKKELVSKIEATAAVTQAMREFTDVAALNLIGKPGLDGDLVYTTEISKALEGSCTLTGTKIEFLRDKAAEQILRKTIATFPRFPFSYHVMAGILQERCDLTWREFAKKGLSILEKTTLVGNHHPNHD